MTDRELITRFANAPYPSASTSVLAPRRQCSRDDCVVLYVDIRKLRQARRISAGDSIDVRLVVPDWLLEEYPALRL